MGLCNTASSAALGIACLFSHSACVGMTYQADPPLTAARTGGVTFIGPSCARVSSCLVGQVTAAETAVPLARAAVFLVREGGDAKEVVRITRLTDDQGAFTVADAPAGSYRIAVYKNAREFRATGLQLGGPGIMVVPVRLAPN